MAIRQHNYVNEANLCDTRRSVGCRTHSSALTLGRREAERTYSSHQKRKTLIHALQPASSHYAPHRKRIVHTCPPSQALTPVQNPLTAAAARSYPHRHERNKGEGRGRSVPTPKGLDLRSTKVRGGTPSTSEIKPV